MIQDGRFIIRRPCVSLEFIGQDAHLSVLRILRGRPHPAQPSGRFGQVRRHTNTCIEHQQYQVRSPGSFESLLNHGSFHWIAALADQMPNLFSVNPRRVDQTERRATDATYALPPVSSGTRG